MLTSSRCTSGKPFVERRRVCGWCDRAGRVNSWPSSRAETATLTSSSHSATIACRHEPLAAQKLQLLSLTSLCGHHQRHPPSLRKRRRWRGSGEEDVEEVSVGSWVKVYERGEYRIAKVIDLDIAKVIDLDTALCLALLHFPSLPKKHDLWVRLDALRSLDERAQVPEAKMHLTRGLRAKMHSRAAEQRQPLSLRPLTAYRHEPLATQVGAARREEVARVRTRRRRCWHRHRHRACHRWQRAARRAHRAGLAAEGYGRRSRPLRQRRTSYQNGRKARTDRRRL